MKKIILAVFFIAGAASLHAQDSTKHKMQHKKMSSDSTHKTWNKSDTSMHHKMKGGKMKKDSTK
jgi:Ni/Co efflux regulator RcnB